MNFETTQEILDWYERQPRTLTDDFIASIPWNAVKDQPIAERLVPVLLYMRDVETLTDMYHRELQRTPTGRDPVISKFMERWGTEEVTHGEVLNRFLNEIGVSSDEKWQSQIRRSVSTVYNVNTFFITALTNLLGSRFTATHMAFGAVHEMTAAQSYRRLMELADHPVLTIILKAIIREEAAHTQFYWNVARLELERDSFARKLANMVIKNFWYPVGQGSMPKAKTEYTIATLFGTEDGVEIFDKTVTRRVRLLPGFDDLTKTTDKVAAICRQNAGPGGLLHPAPL